MPLKGLFSKDFLDEYKSGKRIFSDINLQYAEICDVDLTDLVVKDSRLFFVNFRNCKLANSKFLNCEIFWGGFYNTLLENAVFEKSKIDLTWFEDARFKNTKILNSKISWTAILNSVMAELDTSTSTLFKVFTDPTQATPEDLEEFMRMLGPVLDSLDISIKARVREGLISDVARHGVEVRATGSDNSQYKKNEVNYNRSQAGYGLAMSNLSSTIISAYNNEHPYKLKKDKYQ
ncbi:MAG: hypothetical protein AABX14_01595 [Candidatus Aenigmatarchaeota archaeon]